MIKLNIFTGNFDFLGDSQGGSSSLNIPILMSDPLAPVNGEPWILVRASGDAGNLIYFHGAMPVTENATDEFLFSVQTPIGPKRVELI